jgi:hypothetical protein
MDQESYNKAFIAGLFKRAEELGFEKHAIVGTLAGMGLRIGGSILGQHYLTKGLGAIAARKGLGRVGTHAGKIHNLLTNSPMISSSLGDNIKGQAAFIGTSMLADKALSPIVEPLASRFERKDIPKEYRDMR